MGMSIGQTDPNWNKLQNLDNGAIVPYLIWALPFLVRARQCFISSLVTKDVRKRGKHLSNCLKYILSVIVIFFTYQWALAKNEDIVIKQKAAAKEAALKEAGA